MDEKEQEERVRKVLDKVQKEYGFIPLVSEIMSKRPDLYLPYSELSSILFFKPKHMDQRTTELAAIAASAALGSDHCLNVHIPQAMKVGVTEEEVLEAMLVGAMMGFNRSNSISLRCFKAATEAKE
ncbi:MAG: carboxymuconolactone decarboxylase family protein [Euryarchaeota archaeon]|nr:carboxymuconolactone decarboxylase family protein [Euryarchaeota archaeon]